MHVSSNFFFCHYVFKKPSAAEASETVYMRRRDNAAFYIHQVIFKPSHLQTHCDIYEADKSFKTLWQKEKLLILNDQFLLLLKCFQHYSIGLHSFIEFFLLCLPKCFQRSLLPICCMLDRDMSRIMACIWPAHIFYGLFIPLDLQQPSH